MSHSHRSCDSACANRSTSKSSSLHPLLLRPFELVSTFISAESRAADAPLGTCSSCVNQEGARKLSVLLLLAAPPPSGAVVFARSART